MEVRLDTAHVPPDCYVTLRVGDVQKQSRMIHSKTFGFSGCKDYTEGRLDVFKRVGTLGLCFSNAGGAQDVELSCSDPAFNTMHFTINNTVSRSFSPDDRAVRKKVKSDAAREYLAKHRIEECLAEGMKSLIRQRPSDPHQFLVDHIRGKSPHVILPDIQCASVPPAVPVPIPTLQLGDDATSDLAVCAEQRKRPGGQKLPPLSHQLSSGCFSMNAYYKTYFKECPPVFLGNLYKSFAMERSAIKALADRRQAGDLQEKVQKLEIESRKQIGELQEQVRELDTQLQAAGDLKEQIRELDTQLQATGDLKEQIHALRTEVRASEELHAQREEQNSRLLEQLRQLDAEKADQIVTLKEQLRQWEIEKKAFLEQISMLQDRIQLLEETIAANCDWEQVNDLQEDQIKHLKEIVVLLEHEMVAEVL